MCGIAGFAGQGTRDDLNRMTDALIHRGPDDAGFWSDPAQAIYLGHRRLSIIDRAGGQQPMWSADGRLGIVFNGEIYNFRELRKELEELGHTFHSSHSDTEVLLYAYRQWGEGMTSRLNGMWAFVLYDQEKSHLFCSRDRFGKKPFYYTLQKGTFAFASELNALIKHSALAANVSSRALKKYFAYGYIPAPLSFYAEIQQLPAGCSLVFSLSNRTLRLRQYWEYLLEPIQIQPQGIEQQWAEELRQLLNQAVQRRLVSDVPIGVFLSGGVDSSAVAACAALQTPSGTINTFSIGFDSAYFDESAYAEQAAEHIGTTHHLERLSLEKAQTLLPSIYSRLDEPFGDSSLLPTFLLCQFARKHVTVALGGDGADELFAGYAPFQALPWAERYQRLVPRPLHHAIRLLAERMPVMPGYMSLDFKIKRTLRGLSYPPKLWNPLWMSSIDGPAFCELFNEPVDLEDLFSEAIELWDACAQADVVNRTQQFYMRLYLQNDILTKVDRASMMNSLEVRAPFLDIDLVNFARKIPANYKLRDGQTKYILKKAMEPLLPPETLRRRKQGFAVPIAEWFQDGTLNLETEHLRRHSLNAGFCAEAMQQHRNRMVNHAAFLWNCWVLDSMTDGTTAPPKLSTPIPAPHPSRIKN